MRKLMIAAAIAAASTAPAFAQVNTSGGLVNVSVQNVDILKNFLNNDQIAALNNVAVPITVQVPVGIAANVCGVSAAVLGKAGTDAAPCTANSGSKALANAVAAQKLGQKK
jgi:hypothetical protein